MVCGCGNSNAILTVDSGPAIDQSAGREIYAVHVGERVKFTFRQRLGYCDYAIMHIEGTDYYEDCGPEISQLFEWKHTFDSSAGVPEMPIRLGVKGYAQQEKRDLMPVGGRLVKSERTTDATDLCMSGAEVLIKLYQSHLEITVPAGASKPDWSVSRLLINRENGKVTRVPRRGGGDKYGFNVTGPNQQGDYAVTYEPAVNEINNQGATSAELVVADEAGQTRKFATNFPTP